jgi:hypothetical protein
MQRLITKSDIVGILEKMAARGDGAVDELPVRLQMSQPGSQM